MVQIIICEVCGKEKPLMGKGMCDKCYQREYKTIHAIEHKEYDREYYINNRDRIKLQTSEYYLDNLEACKKHSREKYHNETGSLGMDGNRSCSLFLGVHIAETILSNVFDDVTRMPHKNIGYDFICNKGKKIDVKSSCRNIRDNRSDKWTFSTRHNTIADYFLCIAFDDRESLNPEHLWLIPGYVANGKCSISVSVSTISKWDEYKVNRLDDVIECCNIFRKV